VLSLGAIFVGAIFVGAIFVGAIFVGAIFVGAIDRAVVIVVESVVTGRLRGRSDVIGFDVIGSDIGRVIANVGRLGRIGLNSVVRVFSADIGCAGVFVAKVCAAGVCRGLATAQQRAVDGQGGGPLGRICRTGQRLRHRDRVGFWARHSNHSLEPLAELLGRQSVSEHSAKRYLRRRITRIHQHVYGQVSRGVVLCDIQSHVSQLPGDFRIQHQHGVTAIEHPIECISCDVCVVHPNRSDQRFAREPVGLRPVHGNLRRHLTDLLRNRNERLVVGIQVGGDTGYSVERHLVQHSARPGRGHDPNRLIATKRLQSTAIERGAHCGAHLLTGLSDKQLDASHRAVRPGLSGDGVARP
jgi:hypothetical protein